MKKKLRLLSFNWHRFKASKDYKIYSKEDKKQNCWSFVYHVFWVSGVALLGFYLYNFGDFSWDLSSDHQLWVDTFTILSVIMSFIGGGALIITFREGQKATRRANTLPVCIDIFRELRSQEFLKAEETIIKGLVKGEKDNPEELKKNIKTYLHIMNNISALVIHNIVDEDPIIAYKGGDILYHYELLEPYIKEYRDELHGKILMDSHLSNETKKILNESSCLSYAHFQLFVKQIKVKSSYLIGEFKNKLEQGSIDEENANNSDITPVKTRTKKTNKNRKKNRWKNSIRERWQTRPVDV